MKLMSKNKEVEKPQTPKQFKTMTEWIKRYFNGNDI